MVMLNPEMESNADKVNKLAHLISEAIDGQPFDCATVATVGVLLIQVHKNLEQIPDLQPIEKANLYQLLGSLAEAMDWLPELYGRLEAIDE